MSNTEKGGRQMDENEAKKGETITVECIVKEVQSGPTSKHILKVDSFYNLNNNFIFIFCSFILMVAGIISIKMGIKKKKASKRTYNSIRPIPS